VAHFSTHEMAHFSTSADSCDSTLVAIQIEEP
jgi:hypothetical protein